MARCRSCFKLGLFTKLNDRAYCRACEKVYKENMIEYLSQYQNKISERKSNHYFNLGGIKQNNPETGINRQKIISTSTIGEKIKLVLANEKSLNQETIKVIRFDGRQLGYLEQSDLYYEIKKQLENNIFIDANIASIFGKKGNYGVEVNLTTYN